MRLTLRIAADALTSPVRRPGSDTYADVLRAGLGPALYNALYEPYARKLWGVSGEEISGEQARRRVTADTPWKIAARMLRPRRAARGQGRIFYYPRRGFGQIVEALADAAVSAGASIRLGVAAERLVASSEHVRLTTSRETLEAAQVFSTIPLPVLGQIGGCPPAALEAARRLRFRAMVLVYVVHSGGRYSSYDAHYLPGMETPVTRISEPANYRESADDPTDHSVLCVEIPCAVGDATWRASDSGLAELVDEALARTGLPAVNRDHVVVRRLPHVYPIYDVGFEHHLAALEEWALALPRVTTFGRLGTFAHDNTHHAMVMAYDAVDALTTNGFDDLAWSKARQRHATHVVED